MNTVADFGTSYGCTLAESTWHIWSTDAHLVVTDHRLLDAAEALVRTELDSIDRTCSRFRADSEIMKLTTSDRGSTAISSLLAEFVAAALHAASSTDGAVDPTLGSAMIEIGYDRDFSLLCPADHASNTPSADTPVTFVRRVNWASVSLRHGMLNMPVGVVLDLGATAKALAADRCAELVASTLGCGVLISLGGDISTSGPAPEGGWQIRVCDGEDEPSTAISIGSGVGVATSSTLRRQWAHEGQRMHHILDPHLLQPIEPYWCTVTVAATSCLLANTASTASIVKGPQATEWLEQIGLPARLIDTNRNTILTPQWPVGIAPPTESTHEEN